MLKSMILLKVCLGINCRADRSKGCTSMAVGSTDYTPLVVFVVEFAVAVVVELAAAAAAVFVSVVLVVVLRAA